MVTLLVTGTSREPNLYNGMMKERVFETIWNMVLWHHDSPTRDKCILTDPIEDRVKIEDYKELSGYICSSTFYPQIADYEIMLGLSAFMKDCIE